MTDDLEEILARVASGELTPEMAEPLVAAVTDQQRMATPATTAAWVPGADREAGTSDSGHATRAFGSTASGPSRAVRIRVTDGGRQIVNLRIPMSIASLAGTVIPGLDDPHIARVQQALRDGEIGTILDVRDDDGSGVVIATE